jgi:hypothetical protein
MIAAQPYSTPDTTFLASTTTPSLLDQTYRKLDAKLAKMSETQRQRHEELCDAMTQDYDEVVAFFADYIKKQIKEKVRDFRRKGTLYDAITNPEGKVTEINFKIFNPVRELLSYLGCGFKETPERFSFQVSTLWYGGCFKPSQDGKKFFDNSLFISAFRKHRIAVPPKGVSAVVLLVKRNLAPSFISVTDISDKSVSQIDVWSVKFYYKEASLATAPTAPTAPAAPTAPTEPTETLSEDDVEDDVEADADASVE